MPIRPENRGRYPADWAQISLRIRTERAQGRCECSGQCGSDHAEELRQMLGAVRVDGADVDRCMAANGQAHPVTFSKVVLTVAHLNHTPEDCQDENLMAACQRCHLRYDRDHHAKTRGAARQAVVNGQMDALFPVER